MDGTYKSLNIHEESVFLHMFTRSSLHWQLDLNMTVQWAHQDLRWSNLNL